MIGLGLIGLGVLLSEAAGLGRRLHRAGADGQALRRVRADHQRADHGRLRADDRGHLDDRLRRDLQFAAGHLHDGGDRDRRRRRGPLLRDGRDVVADAHGHHPVRDHDRRDLRAAAAVRDLRGGRLERDVGRAAGELRVDHRDRLERDLHLLPAVLLRPDDRPGHLAADLHRARREGDPARHDLRRRVLHRLRDRGRADRGGGEGRRAAAGVARRGLRGGGRRRRCRSA